MFESMRNQARQDERAQMILIGGVLIASILLILVLILNGVLYTENIATREQPQAIDRGVDVIAVSEDTTHELIVRGNEARHETEGQTATLVNQRVSGTSDYLELHYFDSHGEIIEYSLDTHTNAWVIVQEETSEFTSADRGSPPDHALGWNLGEFNGVRGASMTVTDVADHSTATDLFRMDVSGSDGTWSVWIFEESGDIALGTQLDGSAEPIVECSGSGSESYIDLVEMTIDGNDCGVDFAEGVGDGPYTIDFHRGDEIEGTYEFIVGKGDGAELGQNTLGLGTKNVYDTMDGDSSDPENPTAYDGVYSGTLNMIIEGPTLSIDTETYVAPHQPDNTTAADHPGD